MDLQKLINSRLAINFGLLLGRLIGSNNGYRISNLIADLVSIQKASNNVRAVHMNQLVLRSSNVSKEQLNNVVKSVFRHAGRCIVDLYSNLNDSTKLISLLADTAETESLINLSNRKNKRGLILAAIHQSNFDLAMVALGYRGLKAQVLTFAQPSEAYRLQNNLRAKCGMDIAPISETTLLKAVKRLKEGGIVITGIDRPIYNTKQTLNFFNQPAPLPVGHIRMALATGALIRVVAIQLISNGIYHLLVSDPISMTNYPDSKEKYRINGEKVLQKAEQYIRQAPEQWLMFYPVWPTTNANSLKVNGT